MQLAAARAGQRTQRRDDLLERVGRVRVVDHHLGLVDGTRGHALHAARHRRHEPGHARGVGHHHALRAQAADHGKQVVHVVVADQRRRDRLAARAAADGHVLDQREREAAVAVADVLGDQACARVGTRRVRPRIDLAAAQLVGQQRTGVVVDVDHRRLQAHPAEQQALGGPVVVHAAVVVEVVAREVGEEGDLDARAREALFDDADRAGLDRAGGEAVIGHATERGLQQYRVGCRQAGGLDGPVLRGVARCDRHGQRRHADAQRADEAGAPAQQVQRLRRPPGGRRLAVGARRGRHLDGLAGLVEERRGDLAGGGLHVLQRRDARVLEAERVDLFFLDEARRRARRERARDERAAVVGVARPGDEAVAGLDGAAVGAQRAGDPGLEPAGRGGGGFQAREWHVSAARPPEGAERPRGGQRME